MNKNEIYQLEIIDMTQEGNGVGKKDGFAVFVPNTAVGDLVEVKLLKVLKNFAYGKIENILSYSPMRQEVDCPCFIQCGGCTYRHISYEAELSLKQKQVADVFQRIGGIFTPISSIIASNREKYYRNKAQYPVGQNQNNELVSGFYAKRSHRIVSSDGCLLQSEDFSQIQKTIMKFIKQYKIAVYDEKTGKGLVRHIYIRKAEATGEVMVCVVATSPRFPNVNELIELLKALDLNIVSVILNINPKNTNVILGEKCITLYGKDKITDIICGIEIEISPLAFYQVNKEQAETLYQTALSCAKLQKEDVLIDLYCGTGTIGLIAANQVKQVIGIEIISQAIENAKKNAKRNQIKNTRFICGDAKVAAKQLAEERVEADVIIVDPPRKGLDIEVIEAIYEIQPSRVVMISCNPATAARDCKLLEEKGYEVKTIIPVDMFPRTCHVEVCVLMSRVEK